ncbi:MAG: HNH endonuclease [Staphylococcus sp.]|mgnify:CR=1 FL=1|jgi:hypothetical protein|nr:HNH endonuclease [Staphylococcus sp.]
MLDRIHQFYLRKAYKDLSYLLKLKSEGKCSECGRTFSIDKLRTHHIIELNLNNIDDVTITLNPENIKVVCHGCHNKEHRRFSGRVNKKVYLVYGAPCSGKTSYVNQVATRYDLIVDLDKIHQAICVCDIFDKPDATKKLAYDIRDLLIDAIKVRKGDWENAYVIGTYPKRSERERLITELGAEPIYIASTKEECINRVQLSEERLPVKEEITKWIEKYFEEFRK